MQKKGKLKTAEVLPTRIITEDSWREPLDAVVINDDHWWCMVTFMVETCKNDFAYTSAFVKFAEDGYRNTIYAISYEKLMATVKLLSKPDLDECPILQGICHYASKLIRDKEPITTSLMAKIIKFMIFRAKAEMIRRIKKVREIECEIERELLIMQTVAEIPPLIKTEKSVWKGKCPSDENRSFKANTKLRRRGEEWRDKVYVDDAPTDGPNLYVILTGFYDPELPVELSNVDIPVTCILKMKIPCNVLEIARDADTVDDPSSKPSKRLFLNVPTQETDMDGFWATIDSYLRNPVGSIKYDNFIFRTFCPPEMNFQYYGAKKEIYDRLSFIMFDIYDLTRQYATYVQNTKLQNIFEERPTFQNLDLYSNIMNAIPEECISVPILLKTLLLQVEKNVAAVETTPEPCDESICQSHKSPHRRSTGGSQAAPKTTSLTMENSESSSSWLTEKLRLLNLKYELISPPAERESQLILHADSLTLNTYHATEAVDTIASANSNFKDVATLGISVLEDPRIENYWSTEKNASQFSFRDPKDFLDLVTRYCEDEFLDRSTIMHYLNLIGFKTLERSPGVERGNNDANDSECISLIDRMIDDKQDSSGLVSFSIQKFGHQSIDELECAELISESVLQQCIYDCFRTFDQHQIQYFQPTDSVLLIFSHKFDSNGINRFQASANLRTPVCLREFCRFTVYEEETWFKEQEELKQMKLPTKDQNLATKTPHKTDHNIFTDADFLLPGSLKANREHYGSGDYKFAQEQSRSQIKSPKVDLKGDPKKNLSKSTTTAIKPGKDLNEENKATEVDTSFLPLREIIPCNFAKDQEPFSFIAYDLGNCRIEVSNVSETFFSADGTRVRVDREEWLYSEKTLSLTISYPESDLVFHALTKNNQLNLHSFHLTTRSGIIMAFSGESLFNRSPIIQSRSTMWDSNNFQITWPSGLVVQLVPNHETNEPFYVLQKYISKSTGPECKDIKKEIKRKYLRNGEVLKYLDDGTVVSLRPNSTVITYKFRKGLDKPNSNFPGKRSSSSHLNRSLIKNGSSEDLGEAEQPSSQTLLTPSQSDAEITLSEGERDVCEMEYTVLEHDGRRYQVCNDVIRELNRLRVRTASEYSVAEKFIRRTDGTDMLLKITGEQLVSFPDGTRTATSFEVEKEPITCGWLEDDFDNRFSKNPAIDITAHPREQSTSPDDSFVSIVLNCHMEHPNYAGVSYHGASKTCTLSMPDDVEVELLPDDVIIVRLGLDVELRVQRDAIVFSKRVCDICDGISTSTFQILNNGTKSVDRAVLTTSDMLGNIFEVKHDGCTTFTPAMTSCGCATDGYQKNCWEMYPNEKEDWQHAHESEGEEHLNVCLPAGFPLRSKRRIFAMNRDRTAYEYHHRSVLRKQKKSIFLADEAAMFLHPIPQRPNMEYQLSFIPPTPLTLSKAWLQPHKIPEVIPTYDRMWNFPRNERSQSADGSSTQAGNKIKERIWFEPLIDMAIGKVPPVLITRLLEGIGRENDDAIIAVQRALACALQESFDCEEKSSENLKPLSGESSEEGFNLDENRILLEITEFALGIRKTIDAETYSMYHSNVVKAKEDALEWERQKQLDILNRKKEREKERERQQDLIEMRQILRELIDNWLDNAMGVSELNAIALRNKRTNGCRKK